MASLNKSVTDGYSKKTRFNSNNINMRSEFTYFLLIDMLGIIAIVECPTVY